jgi:ABC-type branched-subunit amino acid transport system permease subunit
MTAVLRSPALRRLVACLAGSLVLALMWGAQEGSQTDYGFAFRQSILKPRVFVFLAIGVLVFLAISFWPRVVPYLARPGVWPLAAGGITVLAAQTLMRWYDPIGDAKFGTVATAVAHTSGLSPVTTAFFAWLAWTQLIVLFAVGAIAAVLRSRPLAWAALGLSVVAAVICYFAHHDVTSVGGGIDHSLGSSVAVVGYLVMALAAGIVAVTEAQVADSRALVNRVLGWRAGAPLVALGLILGVLAFTSSTWFSPQNHNATLSDTHRLFRGYGLAPIAVQYLIWLGWALLAVGVIMGGAATYLRSRSLSWATVVLGVVAVVLSLVTIYDLSDLGAKLSVDGATGPWQNLGTGGWIACLAFFLIASGGFIAATTRLRSAAPATGLSAAVSSGGGRFLRAPGASRTLLLAVMALALFYPPTLTTFWQQVLVGEIGIYVLLAIGLNVVVGWAGLLDLGYIAFYAIGSYTTAYLVGSLPIKPPSWLQMSPLLAIPFAIAVCLLAGVALGAPTLRLRGDYLAIVTLGFGEIVRIIAVNADAVTNGSQGPPRQVPHPVIRLGPIHITWGLNQLQYWYLLLVLILIVVILFSRLENSRIGRSWAAIREDEVAAQASGINTFRIKLLAFAIGASTSGVAGVFFASQVGFFTPDNFVLNNSILVVAYVVFGGMGSLPGVIAGAALLTWLPEFLKDQVPGPDRQMWIGAVLLLMMIFRPGGLIPERRRQVEMGHAAETPPTPEPRVVPADEGLGVAEGMPVP